MSQYFATISIMKNIFILMMPLILFSQESKLVNLLSETNDNSFITQYEYGKMLFNNPRGISCKKCHGDKAQGKFISKFEHKVKSKKYNCVVETYDIKNVNLNDFRDKLDQQKKDKKINFKQDDVCKKLIYGNIMPKYFLTNDEVDSIYFYIRNVNNNE